MAMIDLFDNLKMLVSLCVEVAIKLLTLTNQRNSCSLALQ